MINCIVIDDDALMRHVLKEMILKHPDLSFTAEFDNAIDASAYIKKNKADLIFLDIEMPKMNGMEFLEAFENSLPNVIITTSHQSFALKAFQYDVSGYLVKPIKSADFLKAIEKVLKNRSVKINKETDDIYFVKKGSTIKKISVNDISLIECIGDYVTIYTDSDKFTIHSTMKAIEQKFNNPMFLRVHRSYIVRIDKIEEIEDDSMSFGKKIVPIGKTYKQEVFQKLKML